jgi:hypothetical protein
MMRRRLLVFVRRIRSQSMDGYLVSIFTSQSRAGQRQSHVTRACFLDRLRLDL